MSSTGETTRTVDVLIIGAGISGISAAVHLKRECPWLSFSILERRPRVGGTWDLFRYPGVRSDSDMYTLGFGFKPWTSDKSIASGPVIREYLEETVREHELESRIEFGKHVKAAEWSTQDARWSVTVRDEATSQTARVRCSFLFVCGGYYNYDKGYTPNFPNADSFRGELVHPQHWPENFDATGKRIVVIGSGATAVTLVPALVQEGAASVVMLQRSPTYMVSRPSSDTFANSLRKLLPPKSAYILTRWKNVLAGSFFFNLARKRPEKVKAKLLEGVQAELGEKYDIEKDFTPHYNPWDQRLCLVPDSDFFRAVKNGRAEIVTAEIDRFSLDGVLLTDGRTLHADVIVTATGLNLQMLAGMAITVDGEVQHAGHSVLHKGIMLSGLPNLAMWFGYTNASWTLKADLTSEYMCRMLTHMRNIGKQIVTAIADPGMATSSFADFSSGYFQRAEGLLPKQGDALPWKLHQNYFRDIRLLRHGRIDEEGLVFSNRADLSLKSEANRTTDDHIAS